MADTRMPTTSAGVSEAVQEQIHFDTLWSTAQDALEVYAGQLWSARGDDDPGVTLLQAFAYGVSDVSYRHTLPLVDLLTERTVPNPTPVESPRIHLNHDGGIFAREFGPEWALTSSPVTLADYRRAILDLAAKQQMANGATVEVLCFRDAQIALLPPGESYGYTYDADHYAFQFVSDTTPEAARYRVSGRYRLWVTLNPEVDVDSAQQVLENYLKDHRNLCEWEIVPEKVVTVTAQQPAIQLILEDDLPTGNPMNHAVAEAIWAINQALLPAPVRRSAMDRLAAGEVSERIYSGPRLEHGWLSQLPAERAVVDGQLAAYSVPVQVLSAAVVGVVPGIKAIKWPQVTEIKIAANEQAQLWVDSNKERLVYPGTAIQVYKRGQQITTSPIVPDEVVSRYQVLRSTAFQASADRLREVPYGRYRNPGFYRSVGSSLPPVYGLQQGAEAFGESGDKSARQLLQFLRAFEQQLANRADQLAKLPRVLAFDGRDPAGTVWGASSWPRPSDDPLTAEQTQAVFEGDHTLGWLYWVATSLSQDKEKELAILNYLLGYFGEQRAPRALVGDSFDSATFLPVQQGFLRQVTRLAYERAAISISKVSALQRKVAARLGVGEALFDEALQRGDAPFPKDSLPFYVIEHQELLPSAPDPKAIQAGWPAGQTVQSATDDGRVLTLELAGAAGLKPGQLIELQGTLKAPASNVEPMEPLTAIVLHEVQGEKVLIDLSEHARLQRSLKLLESGQYVWRWRLAQSWLKRVVYDLQYEFPGKATDPTVTLKVAPSFPVELVKSQRFALRPKGRWQYWPTKSDLTDSQSQNDLVVEVVDADPILGTVTVKWIAQVKPQITIEPEPSVNPVDLRVAEDHSPAWPDTKEAKFHYAWAVPYASESFSFTLSIVLNREWLKGSQNPGELSQWIEQIVREEMPSHLNLQLHWISDFNSFSDRYQKWQNSGRPVGDQSYELLRLLGIGERPVDERAGIGFVHVASQDESTKVETATKSITSDDDRDKALQKYSVVYVRKVGFKSEELP
ncbi:hypothetical protein U6010_11070 [Pseudomonas aeruginosa]|uniref:hypothetical protein n=1 Tax=Pseudomonas aeruginosa TaxID=287 RepID=UPI002ADE57AE|nr:hypothetical protein [Pseudomonas aeruginosa]MEA0988982.1 hypothetical protein [Pseudomonas aeruginosa]